MADLGRLFRALRDRLGGVASDDPARLRARRRAGIVAGGSAAYSNGVLIGIPLMQAALGDDGTVFLIVIVAVHLPIMMLVSVLLNEWMLARDGAAAGATVARARSFAAWPSRWPRIRS